MYVSAGKVILDFYGNQELKTKRRNLEELLHDLRSHFNLSANEVADFDDLERCVLGLALCAGSEKGAQTAMKKVLDHIDSTSFARVVVEDVDTFAFD